MTFAEKLHNLRVQNGLSVYALSGRIGIPDYYLQELETKNVMPDIQTVLALSRYFGVSTDQLLRDDVSLDYEGAILDAPKSQEVALPDVAAERLESDEEAARYCPKCGRKNGNASDFCGACGHRLLQNNIKPLTNEEYRVADDYKSEGHKFCPECGRKTGTSSGFCGVCGHRFSMENKKPLSKEEYDVAYYHASIELQRQALELERERFEEEKRRAQQSYEIECKKLEEAKIKTRQQKEQIELERKRDQDVARCPKCGSTSLSANRKRISLVRGVAGYMVFGPLGAIAGGLSSDKVKITCMKCGYSAKAEKFN